MPGATDPERRSSNRRAAASLTAGFRTLSSVVGGLLVVAVVSALLIGGFHAAATGTADLRDHPDVGAAFASFDGRPADGGGDGHAAGGGVLVAGSTNSSAEVLAGGSSDRSESALDADGDGYPDALERSCPGLLPNADPQGHDVYVEVDATGNATLDDRTVERLEDAFRDAPVTGPDGESGVRLHVVRSDTGLPERGPVDIEGSNGSYDDVWDYREKHFDRAGAGYYYVLLTSNAAYEGDTYYAGAGTNGTAVVESYDDPDVMTSLIMHELGHAFGLGDDHAGVDSREYDRAAYESVMNYNALYEVQTYADGDDDVGRNEWEYVVEDRYTPTVDPQLNGSCTGA